MPHKDSALLPVRGFQNLMMNLTEIMVGSVGIHISRAYKLSSYSTIKEKENILSTNRGF